MKKLKPFSEIETFDDVSISRDNQVNILGGQTSDYYSITVSTCEWSCQDTEVSTLRDTTVVSTRRIDTENDC
ncbi:hypothetical protein [Psychroserpens sp. MEBiC05023]